MSVVHSADLAPEVPAIQNLRKILDCEWSPVWSSFLRNFTSGTASVLEAASLFETYAKPFAVGAGDTAWKNFYTDSWQLFIDAVCGEGPFPPPDEACLLGLVATTLVSGSKLPRGEVDGRENYFRTGLLYLDGMYSNCFDWVSESSWPFTTSGILANIRLNRLFTGAEARRPGAPLAVFWAMNKR